MCFLSEQDRVDEYNYKETLEGQEKLPMEKHWRKHTMSTVDQASNVSFYIDLMP